MRKSCGRFEKNDQTTHLDTSAIVKRYITENGTDKVDELYEEAHAGKIRISFSLWNIREVAVVLDKYCRRGTLEGAKGRIF